MRKIRANSKISKRSNVQPSDCFKIDFESWPLVYIYSNVKWRACDVITSSLQRFPIASNMVTYDSSACCVLVSLYQRGVTHDVRMACHWVTLSARCHPWCSNGVSLGHFISAVSPLMYEWRVIVSFYQRGVTHDVRMACDHSSVGSKSWHFVNMSASWCIPVLSNFISDWLTHP